MTHSDVRSQHYIELIRIDQINILVEISSHNTINKVSIIETLSLFYSFYGSDKIHHGKSLNVICV